MTAREEVNNLLEHIDQLEERAPQDERSRTNILIVDDEQIMRDLLTDVLRTEGYNVGSLSQPEEALKKATDNGVEIIITDIKMKGMNGIELLRRVKEINPDIDVIVMTGYASVQTAVESMKLGAVDYLTKPLNIDQVRLIVNKTTERRFLKRRASESVFYKKLSRLDGLTELFNHRFFQQLLNIEVARAKREGWPLSLIMLDIDDFKVFNDKNGHPMGDLALKKLSWLLSQNCRQCDFVARYGGEEFTIIIPNADKETARLMANRLRKVVEKAEFEHEDSLPQGRFTISLGVAEYPTDAQSREELIEKADQALYQAKSRGKNRVVVYNDNSQDSLSH
jgi:diguanylate cyclase (GGDEF)-like protein